MTAIFAAIILMLCLCIWLKVPHGDLGYLFGGVLAFGFVIAALHIGLVVAASTIPPELQTNWQVAGR